MHILVTGGAGYIGSHVVKLLCEQTTHRISILDNFSTGHRSTLETLQTLYREHRTPDAAITLYETDLCRFDEVETILREGNFDALMHFAASIIVPESVSDPLKYYMNNTVNTTNLIAQCVAHGVNRFIFSSTAAVYGNPQTPQVDENTPTAPINPYGMSKWMSEQVLRDTSAAHPDFRHVILRYFNVAGADVKSRIGQSVPDATHLIKVAIQTALGMREHMMIFGDDYATPDGTCVRDYIHVDDLAQAHLDALAHLAHNGVSELFNVGYGHGYSVKEVIETVRQASGHTIDARMAPRRSGDTPQLIADSRKLRKELGWKPRYDDLSLICRTALAWEAILTKEKA